MSQSLFTLSLKNKRDLLRARQLTRQTADILGFDSGGQMCLAAAVFDLSCQAHAASGRASIRCEIDGDFLCILCAPTHKNAAGYPASQRLSKRLPAAAAASAEDVAWIVQQLTVATPLDLFDEMQKVNQEFLKMLLEQAQEKGVELLRIEPSAA